VLDRLIQQAVLQADWDPTFSEASFGLRPGRCAHQAVARAQECIAAGYGWVVDIDLEKFFDRVNHDILMGLVAKRMSDRRLLRLIRGFLTAGVLAQGLGRADRRRNPARGSAHSLNAKGNFCPEAELE
jgi:RNA-directed DNA polymerase